MDGGSRPGGIGALAPLAAELGDLKRIRDASSPDSLAVRAFRGAWGRLAAGEAARDVALSVTADALAACRLGGIDRAVLEQAGVSDRAPCCGAASTRWRARWRRRCGTHCAGGSARPPPPAARRLSPRR